VKIEDFVIEEKQKYSQKLQELLDFKYFLFEKYQNNPTKIIDIDADEWETIFEKYLEEKYHTCPFGEFSFKHMLLLLGIQ
jgi:hypothetical protein